MITITRKEADMVRKYFPWVHIRRTTHRYYMEEDPKAVSFLKSVNAPKR